MNNWIALAMIPIFESSADQTNPWEQFVQGANKAMMAFAITLAVSAFIGIIYIIFLIVRGGVSVKKHIDNKKKK